MKYKLLHLLICEKSHFLVKNLPLILKICFLQFQQPDTTDIYVDDTQVSSLPQFHDRPYASPPRKIILNNEIKHFINLF